MQTLGINWHMSLLIFYLTSLVLPLIWWPVAAVGVLAYRTNRSLSILLVVLGSAVLGTLGLLSVLTRPGAEFDASGNAEIHTVALLPVEAHILVSTIGVSLVVVGLIMLLLRMGRAHVDT